MHACIQKTACFISRSRHPLFFGFEKSNLLGQMIWPSIQPGNRKSPYMGLCLWLLPVSERENIISAAHSLTVSMVTRVLIQAGQTVIWMKQKRMRKRAHTHTQTQRHTLVLHCFWLHLNSPTFLISLKLTLSAHVGVQTPPTRVSVDSRLAPAISGTARRYGPSEVRPGHSCTPPPSNQIHWVLPAVRRARSTPRHLSNYSPRGPERVPAPWLPAAGRENQFTAQPVTLLTDAGAMATGKEPPMC